MSPTPGLQVYANRAGTWKVQGRSPYVPGGLPGFTPVLVENFDQGSLASIWHPYDDSVDGHYGGTSRIQAYRYANVVVGAGSAGATDGQSLKLLSKEVDAGVGSPPTAGDAGTRYSYSGGMLDTKTAGVFYPRYLRAEWRCKTPHGQGLWPSIWMTGKNGGANMVEYDILEYFHAQVPGRNSSTIHSAISSSSGLIANRYTNNGSAPNGGGPVRTPFETPTYTPGWHVWACEITPVSDGTGATPADPTLPSQYVKLVVSLDGTPVWTIVDTNALYYTTNGGDENAFWNFYLQGCQIDGNSVGHPRSPLGYSHWTNLCLIGGSPPSSCTIVGSSGTVQAPVFNDPASTLEIDYFKVWKYTG